MVVEGIGMGVWDLEVKKGEEGTYGESVFGVDVGCAGPV